MRKYKKDLLVLLIPLVICLIIYPFLPDRIPKQFGFDGSVTYMSKNFIFLTSLIPYLVYLKYKSKK